MTWGWEVFWTQTNIRRNVKSKYKSRSRNISFFVGGLLLQLFITLFSATVQKPDSLVYWMVKRKNVLHFFNLGKSSTKTSKHVFGKCNFLKGAKLSSFCTFVFNGGPFTFLVQFKIWPLESKDGAVLQLDFTGKCAAPPIFQILN